MEFFEFRRKEERISREESGFKVKDKDGDRGGGSFRERLVPTGQQVREKEPMALAQPLASHEVGRQGALKDVTSVHGNRERFTF